MNAIAGSITFFRTKAAASALVAGFLADGAEASEYRVSPAKGRPGNFVVAVLDPVDGFVLGLL